MKAQDQALTTKCYRVIMSKPKSPKSVGCVTREMNVQSWLRLNIRKAKIESPLWFTENYVAKKVLNLLNTGMDTEQKG